MAYPHRPRRTGGPDGGAMGCHNSYSPGSYVGWASASFMVSAWFATFFCASAL